MPKKGTKRVRKPHLRREKVGIGNLKVYNPLAEPKKVKGVWKKKKK